MGRLYMLKTMGCGVLIVLWSAEAALAQETQPGSPRSSEQSPQGSSANPAEPLATPNLAPATADELERALKQHEEEQQPVVDPARPRTHRYMDQPVARILRSLAEQAEINYVEPGIPESEVTSVVLTNMTPIQAFEAVARAHGFKIQIDRQNAVYTLGRSDINSPSYYLLPPDGTVLSQGNLYRFYDSTSHTWKSFYSYTVTANVLALNEGTASEIRNITLRLTYQVEGRPPASQLNSQTIFSDAISRRKS
jgi:hypothetical protein